VIMPPSPNIGGTCPPCPIWIDAPGHDVCLNESLQNELIVSAIVTADRLLNTSHSGALQTGLRKRRTDRPPGLSAAPERIEYKVAVLPYKALNGSAPRYLGPLVPVAVLPGRRTLRSAGTNRLLMPPVRLSTVGNRAFTVAGSRVWNTLPEDICLTTSQSLSAFCQRLKTWLFRKSYPDIIM